MKKEIKLSVASPCAEKWDHFTPTSKGAFCQACSKNVIDFTKMSQEEIFLFFNNRTTPTCGRFRPDQLKSYSQKDTPNLRPGLKWVQAGFLSLFLVLVGKQGSAQHQPGMVATEFVQIQDQYDGKDTRVNLLHAIKGVVRDENNETIPGVSIYLKGTKIGTTTDINGEFKFPKELVSGDVLVFHFIGYETIEYVVPKNATEALELHMFNLYPELMGDVDVDEVYTGKAPGSNHWWQRLKNVF